MKRSIVKIVANAVFTLLLFTQTGNAQQFADAQNDRLHFPFSQYVIRSDWAMPITWKYRPYENIVENESIIAPPKFGED